MRSTILAILALCVLPAVNHAERSRIELNGTWEFKLDPQDQGPGSEGAAAFDRKIVGPGAWQAQGVGEPRGTLRHDYERTTTIPHGRSPPPGRCLNRMAVSSSKFHASTASRFGFIGNDGPGCRPLSTRFYIPGTRFFAR